MSLNGPDALRSIEEALRDVRREEDDATRRLARSTELVAKLRAQETSLFRHLGAGDMPELGAALAAAGKQAETALIEHDSGFTVLDAKVSALDTEIADVATLRAARQLEAEKHDSALRRFADAARPDLISRPDYRDAVERASSTAAIAAASLDRTERAEHDRSLKARPYRDDPLFMYLWEKGYGTTAYRPNLLVGWLDSRIAELIGYDAARVIFAAMNDIPLRRREHTARLGETAAAAARQMRTLEAQAVDAAGGTSARASMEAARKSMSELDGKIVALQDQRDEAIRARRHLAQGGEPNFAVATAALVRVLSRPELERLLAEARGGEDDTLVQQVVDVRQRAAENTLEAGEEKTRLKLLALRRRELEDIQYEVKALSYDSPRSRFSRDELGGEVLNDFLRGEISAVQYWQIWRQSQSWDSPEMAIPGSGGTTFSRPRRRPRVA